MKYNKVFVYFLIFTATFGSVVPGWSIEVGTAKTDITPPDSIYLWGYGNRTLPSEGTIDPLMAKVVVFDDGVKKAAIITVDLGRTFPEKELKQLQNELKERYGLVQTLITASHTHAAPGYGNDPVNQKWLKDILPQLVEMVGRAVQQTKNAIFKTATGSADLSYDRRVIKDDGSVEMLWSNFERLMIRPVDQKVRAIFINDSEGKPIVTLVHYACHPVMTGQENLKVSADFPAYMSEVIEDQIGGMSMFVQGAAGNINPYMAAIVSADRENGIAIMKAEGVSLGNTVVALKTQARKVKTDSLMIRYSSIENHFEARYDWEDDRTQNIVKNLYLENPEEKIIHANVSILTLGDQFAWAGFPGEFFDEFQQDLVARSPIPQTYFVGYCNGHFTYFPTIEAAAQGGYGADIWTLPQIGAGEAMVDASIISLYRISEKIEGK